MKILFATTVLPAKRRTGGEIVSDTFVQRLLALGHQVDVAGYVRPGDRGSARVVETIVGERPIETDSAGKLTTFGWIVQAIFKRWPYSSSKYYSTEYCDIVNKSSQYDLVIIDHAQLGIFLGSKIDACKIIHISHNVEHDLYLQQAQGARSLAKKNFLLRESERMQFFEKQLAERSRQVWCLTKADAAWFSQHNNHSFVFSVPSNSDIIAQLGSGNMQSDIGIIGTWSWDANRKGLEWFFDQVYPLLPKDIGIRVAGKGADWLKGKFSNVQYLGFVDSAAEFMGCSRIISVPSTEGGGIQIKTLDAIASGRPVVGTSVSVRGIEDLPDSFSIADSPEQFAQAMLTALNRCNDVEMSNRAIGWINQRNDNFDKQLSLCLEKL